MRVAASTCLLRKICFWAQNAAHVFATLLSMSAADKVVDLAASMDFAYTYAYAYAYAYEYDAYAYAYAYAYANAYACA